MVLAESPHIIAWGRPSVTLRTPECGEDGQGLQEETPALSPKDRIKTTTLSLDQYPLLANMYIILPVTSWRIAE